MTALGPDRQTPHGLLPPFQSETLSFERPWEVGFEWKGSTATRSHDVWISWQRVNTASHRERFNAGVAFERRRGRVAGVVQAHVVHEGGQLFGVGAVRDSGAGALGLSVDVWRGKNARLTVLAAWLAANLEPDRAVTGDVIRGDGTFSRVAYLRGPLRAHAIYWHANDFAKVEGDPNYAVLRRDGSRFNSARDYFETGVAREFRPAPSLRRAGFAIQGILDPFFDHTIPIERRGGGHDPKVEHRKISPLFTKGRSEDGEEAESRNVREPGRRREARAGRSVLQTPLNRR